MADSFARFSSIIESARDITIDAAVSASTRLTETPTAKRPQEIAKLLSSRLDREVLSGMKCVMALVAAGDDGSVYFADVVKNVTLTNARVRALVMLYVEKYAESEPDTALLSINSVQKLLADKAPNVRAASIRTLGGIRIPEIASLLLLCIKRTLTDRLPEVRSATALAIGSAFTIEGIQKLQLLKHLATLMGDASPLVVGSAVKVFFSLKPQLLRILRTRTWAPVHANFKRYVRLLLDLDDWSRAMLTDLLVEYCLKFIPRPTLVVGDGSREALPDDFASFPKEYECEMDQDLKSFVHSLGTATYSSSTIVVLSAVRALVTLATPRDVSEGGFPKILIKLIAATASEPEKLQLLQLILMLASCMPEEFQGAARKFFLHPNDSTHVAKCKLQILLALFTDDSALYIIKELQYNATSYRREIAQNAVQAIGFCCQKSSRWTDRILYWCLLQMEDSLSGSILADLLKVVRFLLQQKQAASLNAEQVTRTVYKLSMVLDNRKSRLSEEAKASIIWTIGEFTQVTNNIIGPDVLRRSLKSYAQEPEKVRFELLLLAAKAYLFELQELTETSDPKELSTVTKKMFEYVMQLARYDMSTSTRDKARMFDELFSDIANHQLAYLFMQAPKYVSQITDLSLQSHYLARYMKKLQRADASSLPPLSIRKEAIGPKVSLASYKNDSWSSAAVASPTHKEIPKPQFETLMLNSNRLQSLDEFFGDEDESDDPYNESSEKESESSLSEEEDDEEEEDDDSRPSSDSEVLLLEHGH